MSRLRRPCSNASSVSRIMPEKQSREVRGRSVSSIQRKTKVIANNIKLKPKYSSLTRVILWPAKVLSSTYNYVYYQVCRYYDSDSFTENESIEDEVINFVPSILTFAIGLVIIKFFEESIDSLFASLMSSSHWAASSLEDVYDSFSYDEFENLARLFFVGLFWYGGFRIVTNLMGKIFRATKTSIFYNKKFTPSET